MTETFIPKYPYDSFYKAFVLYQKGGRKIIVLYNTDKDRTTISYARYLMSVKLKRKLTKLEHVHHIDRNTSNDSYSNLMVLSKVDHKKLHETRPLKKCKKCNRLTKNKIYCSVKCCGFWKRKVKRPTIKYLLKLLKTNNFCAVGRKFGVSDNTIRKWLKSKQK